MVTCLDKFLPLGVVTYLHELGVDLEVGRRLVLLEGGAAALLDAREEMVDGAGDDARLLLRHVQVEPRPHRVRLTRSSLQYITNIIIHRV